MSHVDNFEKKLELMDELFDGLLPWLGKLYDPISGGFYYAKSSIDDDRFTPDIESTAQGLNILLRNDLIKDLPIHFKRKMIHFFQSKQQENTGYFLDENPEMVKDEVMVHRAISYACGSLEKLGDKPLYPLPLQSKAAPKYVETPKDYLEKWRRIDLSNSWRGCDLLATSCVYISEMKEDEREPFINEAVHYLESIQDKETGLWGEGSLYVRISGTFKLHTFYSRFNIPIPNADLIYKSILTCLREESAGDMCYIRNPINLLAYMKRPIPEADLIEILEITMTNMRKLKRKDGGFSRKDGNSPAAPNIAQVEAGDFYPNMPEAVNLSQGLYEGDMNATTQAILIRLLCYQLVGLQAPPLSEAKAFLERIV